jgi:hypothetical protein
LRRGRLRFSAKSGRTSRHQPTQPHFRPRLKRRHPLQVSIRQS